MEKVIWRQGFGKNGLRDFLKELFEKEIVNALLVPAKNKTGDSYSWFLMNKNGMLETVDPIPPVMTIQGANIVKDLTGKEAVWEKTAIILRPCELQATIELAKLKQTNLDNLITISFDCPGVYPLKDYLKKDQEKMDREFEAALGTEALNGVRSVCSICQRFTGEKADLQLGMIGGSGEGFWIISGSQNGANVIAAIDGKEVEDLNAREQAVENLRLARVDKRNTILNSFQESVLGAENLMKTLSACINCHNCSRVCPICFCQECYFDSAALRSDADNLLNRAKRKGGQRLPQDLLLFHIGRMNHMSVSCVSCGMCEDACPSDIPVSMLFSLVSRDTQALFDYEPGRRLDEPIPFNIFKHEELKEWEAPYTKRRTQNK